MNIKISIADDHPMIIDGLQNMLGNFSHLTICNTYPDGEKLMKGLEKELPDVLLLDIQLPGKTGDQLAPVILKKYPGIAILILTNFDNAIYLNALMQTGVHGYLLKTTGPDKLREAIESVAKGQRYIDASVTDKLKELEKIRNNSTNSSLSAREKEILQYIVNGATTKKISEELFLSYYTVENYRARILSKLNAKNVADLIRKSLILGLAK
jgi:DNA-binding NarL/FixJ family response regulator